MLDSLEEAPLMHKGMRKLYSLCVVFATFAGLWMLQAQEKQNPNFTGGNVTKLDEGTKATIAHFRFDPGARTKWHSHEGGQIILVEELSLIHISEPTRL